MAGNLDNARNLGVLGIKIELNYSESKMISQFPDCVTLYVLKNGVKVPVSLLSVMKRKKDREFYFGTDEYSMSRVRLVEAGCLEGFRAMTSNARGIIKDKIKDFQRGEALTGVETVDYFLDEVCPFAEVNWSYKVVTCGKGAKTYRSESLPPVDWSLPEENTDFPKLRVGYSDKKKVAGYGTITGTAANTTSYSYYQLNHNGDNVIKAPVIVDPQPPKWHAWEEPAPKNAHNPEQFIAQEEAFIKAHQAKMEDQKLKEFNAKAEKAFFHAKPIFFDMKEPNLVGKPFPFVPAPQLEKEKPHLHEDQPFNVEPFQWVDEDEEIEF